jgi:hypothetical protein
MARESGSPAVQSEWLRRVEAEYRSAAITQHLTLWLTQTGASPDLIRAGLRIANDEIRHAELSHRTFVASGGEGGPNLPRESLELARRAREPLEHDVMRIIVDVFCLGETVAVPLFKLLRDGCTVPVAKRALDRILRDEVRHRDFGWTVLTWFLERPDGAALRGIVAKELPGYFARIRRMYAHGRESRAETAPEDAAWGLMPPSKYAAAVAKTLEKDWVPRFARVGIDARKAWNAAG